MRLRSVLPVLQLVQVLVPLGLARERAVVMSQAQSRGEILESLMKLRGTYVRLENADGTGGAGILDQIHLSQDAEGTRRIHVVFDYGISIELKPDGFVVPSTPETIVEPPAGTEQTTIPPKRKMTEVDRAWLIGYFQAKGSFCRTGDGRFALEAFSIDPDALDIVQQIAGGMVMTPPPAAPTRWTWRLYGPAAKELWEELKPFLSPRLQARGEEKLATCR